MNILFSRFSKSLLVLTLCILMLPVTVLLAPAGAHAFGSLSENGTAAFMGIGIAPQKILHVSGTGPGSVPLFVRGSDSAGFIIERTPTNRWVLGVNESPALGTGFVLSTIPTGTQSVPRLLVTPTGKVGIGTLSPNSLSKLHVVNDSSSVDSRAVFGDTSSGDTYGVYGKHSGTGNYGHLGSGGWGVYGRYGTAGPYGYLGGSGKGAYGYSAGGEGVEGATDTGYGVYGLASTTGNGVFGQSYNGYGVYGQYGNTQPYGYLGGIYNGVHGYSAIGRGVYGTSDNGTAVEGESNLGSGVYGSSTSNYGVKGRSTSSGAGVYGVSTDGIGTYGGSQSNIGVSGYSNSSYAVYGTSGSSGYAGYFEGNAVVTGNLTVSRLAYPTPRTHYYSVPGVAFNPVSSNITYSKDVNVGDVYITAGSGVMAAPVNLPDGAVVTGFRVYLYDTSASNLAVSLGRQLLTGAVWVMSTVSYAGSSGYVVADNATIDSAVIDNAGHGYFVWASWNPSDNSNLGIMGARITYTVSETE